MKVFSSVLALAILCVALNFAAGLSLFVDLTSIAFIAIPVLAAFVAQGFKIQGIQVVRDIVIQVAIVGMLIGFVGILQNMSDPQALGPAYAIMLLVVLYAFIVSGACSFLSANISEELVTPSIGQRVASSGLWLVLCVLAMSGVSGLFAFLDLASFLIFAALSLAILGTSSSKWPKALAQSLPAAGFVGVLIGVIGMFQNMADPKSIGPAMAISLLTLLYCNAVSVGVKLAFPEIALEKSPNQFTYLGFVLLFVMLATAILLLSFA